MANYSDFEFFAIDLAGAVLRVWINRPEARNALSPALMREWDDILDRADSDNDVRVLILRGKGPVFSAGHDLKAAAAASEVSATVPTAITPSAPFLDRSWRFRKVLLAGVHGYVGPAATQLLAPMDMVIAAEGTRFRFDQYLLGSEDPGGTLLAFMLPMRVIKQIWLFGGWFDANTAKELHVVQKVVAPAELDVRLEVQAQIAAQLTCAQIAGYKTGIHRMYEMMGLLEIAGATNRPKTQSAGEAETTFLRAVQELGLKEALRLRDRAIGEVDRQI